MSGVLVVGAGGHAKVVIATLRAAGHEVAGVLDDDAGRWGTSVLGCPVLGGLDRVKREAGAGAVIAVGNNELRHAIAARYAGARWVTAVHPAAVVHETVRIGAGTLVFAGAVVQPDAVLGRHVIVNTGASVDHDGVLGDFAHVAPGAHLAGNVRLGTGAFLGVGCAVRPGARVGDWTTVGAGGVVVHDLPPRVVATGIPARPRGNEVQV